MKSEFFYIIILAISLYTCDNTIKKDSSKVIQTSDSLHTFELKGSWVRCDKHGFVLIDITDSLHVSFTELYDRKADLDTIKDRYWYYNSQAKLGYWDSTTIWIKTDKFRFDYRVKGDTLIEFDKTGVQGKLIKVFTVDQKDFKVFDMAYLKGKISYISKVQSNELFRLDNFNFEFSFTSIKSDYNNNQIFTDIASIGDSLSKNQYGDTLYLYKQYDKKYYKFSFRKK